MSAAEFAVLCVEAVVAYAWIRWCRRRAAGDVS